MGKKLVNKKKKFRLVEIRSTKARKFLKKRNFFLTFTLSYLVLFLVGSGPIFDYFYDKRASDELSLPLLVLSKIAHTTRVVGLDQPQEKMKSIFHDHIIPMNQNFWSERDPREKVAASEGVDLAKKNLSKDRSSSFERTKQSHSLHKSNRKEFETKIGQKEKVVHIEDRDLKKERKDKLISSDSNQNKESNRELQKVDPQVEPSFNRSIFSKRGNTGGEKPVIEPLKPSLTALRDDSVKKLIKTNVSRPLNSLLIGDSLIYEIAIMLNSEMKKILHYSRPKIKSKVSSGLTRKRTFDWNRNADRMLRQRDYDFVLVMLGSNDLLPIRSSSGTIPWGNRNWPNAYGELVSEFVKTVCNRTKHLYWVSIPPVRNKKVNASYKMLNRVIETSISLHEGNCASFVEISPWITKKGAYTTYLTSEKGGMIRVRTSDGIHLTKKGAHIIARQLLHSHFPRN